MAWENTAPFSLTPGGKQEIKHIGVVRMFFLNRLKPKFAEDKNGFFPNSSFTDYYCERFAVKEKTEVQTVLPDFIKNLIGVHDHEREESISKNQV